MSLLVGDFVRLKDKVVLLGKVVKVNKATVYVKEEMTGVESM
jgi:hypothetical protein